MSDVHNEAPITNHMLTDPSKLKRQGSMGDSTPATLAQPCGTPRNHAEEIANVRASVRAETRVDLALAIERLPAPDRERAMNAAIISDGGTFIPHSTSTWGPHMSELSLLGVMATGGTLQECIASWIKNVLRSAAEEVAT